MPRVCKHHGQPFNYDLRLSARLIHRASLIKWNVYLKAHGRSDRFEAMGSAHYHRDFNYLRVLLEPELDAKDLSKVTMAYEVARDAHEGQMRDEGTPYILHPLRVSVVIAEELRMFSPKLLCSALLHDVIEDTDITRDQITEMFGSEVSRIVWLLTKLDDVSLPAYLSAIESASSTGAPVVKLCDRLDNLRFLIRSPKAEKKRRYIRTTEQHYIPMAARCNEYLHAQLLHSLEEARGHAALIPHHQA